jgi:protein involved in polysaccharide export with SLBB domain
MFWKSARLMRPLHRIVLCFVVAVAGLAAPHTLAGQEPGSLPTSKKTEENYVTIFGAVQNPSRITLTGSMRLAEAIKLAGGFSAQWGPTLRIIHTNGRASATTSHVNQLDEETYQTDSLLRGDPAANPQLHAGDFIVVDEAPDVYVTGNVVAPQRLFYHADLTVARAVAMAGGITRDARANRLRIWRQRPGATAAVILTIDLDKIWKRRIEDPRLRPYDIVEVR